MSSKMNATSFLQSLKKRLSLSRRPRIDTRILPAKEVGFAAESDASSSPQQSIAGRNASVDDSSQGVAFGQRLVVSMVDETAATDPSRHWMSIPVSSEAKDGWREVTFGDLANAVNRVARQILDTCGPASADAFPTIAYIAPNDARYIIFLLAAVKAGYKVRNALPPPPAVLNM
jgi:hypothetical protein